MRGKLLYISLLSVLILSLQVTSFAGLRAAWNFEDGAPGGVTADVSGIAPAMNATGQGTYTVTTDPDRSGKVLDPTAGNYNGSGHAVASGGFLAASFQKTQGNWGACTLSLWAKPIADQNGSLNWAVNEQWKFLAGRTNGTGPRMYSMNSGLLFYGQLYNPEDNNPTQIWRNSDWDPAGGTYDGSAPWHHLLVTFDSDKIKAWVDGVNFITRDPCSTVIGQNNGDWGICWDTAAGSAWKVDDVAWFKGYIDDANVIELYNGTKTIYTVTVRDAALPTTSAPPADKLLWWYRMDEAVGSVFLKDYTSNSGPTIEVINSTLPPGGIVDDADRFKVLQMNYNTTYRTDIAEVKQVANPFFMPNDTTSITWWANTVIKDLPGGDATGAGGWMVGQAGNGIRMDRHFTGVRCWLTIEQETYGASVADLTPQGGWNTLYDNEWHHFAVTFDSNCPPGYVRDDPNSFRIPYGATEPNGAPKNVQMAVCALYIDGVMVARDNSKHCGRMAGGDADMWLLQGNGDGTLPGKIDDVRKYHAALTAEQVQYIYQTTHHAIDGVYEDKAYIEAPCNDPNKPGIIAIDQDLRWNPGKNAANHEIWFGTEGAMANQGTQARNSSSFDPAGDLLLSTVYEWKVNESNGASTWPASGSWKFKTANYMMLEDFETYTNDTTVRAAWKLTGNASDASLVDTVAEGIVYHGVKAVKMGLIDLTVSPFRSMYYKTLSTAVNLSSANQNIKALRIAFRGDSVNNKATSICAYLKDSSNRIALIQNTDASSSKQPAWTEWNIPLSDFTAANPSLNLAAIKEYGVGVGTGTSVAGFTAGNMWFDDIRVFQPRCSATANIADITGDCKVDIQDVNKIAFDWLDDGLITGGGKLVALWRFEDGTGSSTAADTSGYSPTANGVFVTTNPAFLAIAATALPADANRGNGVVKSQISFTRNYLNCAVDSGTQAQKFNLGGGATVSAWINPKNYPASERYRIIIGGGNGPGFIFTYPTNLIKFSCGSLASSGELEWLTPPTLNVWTHIAGVYSPGDVNGPTVRLYINGNKVGEKACSPNPGAVMRDQYYFMGYNSGDTWGLDGKLDDVAIYNRALTTAEIRAVKNASSASAAGFVVPTVAPLYEPIGSKGNVYKEALGTDRVNFKDYSIVADKWLENPSLWP